MAPHDKMEESNALVSFTHNVRALAEYTPEEVDRQLITFSPGLAPTRMNLLANPKFIMAAAKVSAYLDCIKVIRDEPIVFDLDFVTHQCNALLGEIVNPHFSVDGWYRKHGPETWDDPGNPQNWNIAKMESSVLTVDWYTILIEEECAHPGFVKALGHCIELYKETKKCIKEEKKQIYGNFKAATGETF